MIVSYTRPQGIEEALDARARNPAVLWLSGGTFILPASSSRRDVSLCDIGPLLESAATSTDDALVIGAGMRFLELAEAGNRAPSALAQAAASMANRNIRARATVGGNIGSTRSCASLIPALMCLGATLDVATKSGERSVPLSRWLDDPEGIITRIRVPNASFAARASSYARYSRTACDLSILTAAVSARLVDGAVRETKLCMGGLSARTMAFPSAAGAIDGVSVRDLADPARRSALERTLVEAIIADCGDGAASDVRGGAGFKYRRAAVNATSAVLGLDGAFVNETVGDFK